MHLPMRVFPVPDCQVWSLTQFFSVDFSQSRIGVKKCVFNKRGFASVVFDGVLGPPHLARHTLLCPCISVVPEATHETETRELLGGTEENTVSPMRGH